MTYSCDELMGQIATGEDSLEKISESDLIQVLIIKLHPPRGFRVQLNLVSK